MVKLDVVSVVLLIANAPTAFTVAVTVLLLRMSITVLVRVSHVRNVSEVRRDVTKGIGISI
jgi:hypothetical protein